MQIDWQQLREQYIQNAQYSMEDVAELAHVDATNLKRRAADEGWHEEKQTYQQVLHRKATKLRLEKIADMESENIVERGRIRLQNWRLIQGNLMALVSKLNVIDDFTGLPNPLIGTQLERAAKTLKDVTQALERAHNGERLELGQPVEVVAEQKLQQFLGHDQQTLEELIAEVKRLEEQRTMELELDSVDNSTASEV